MSGGRLQSVRGLPWHPAASAVALILPLFCVLVPVFLLSDNVHSQIESSAFDRLHLGCRTFWPFGRYADLPPSYSPDPNFPLGSGLIFGLPWLLGLDPVIFGRLHAALWALVAAGALFLLCRDALGPAIGALAGALIWSVPAFVRGAVVSGEESAYTALLLLGLLGLSAAVQSQERGKRRALVLALIGSCLAVNATVLYRLDAMTTLPFFALLAWWGLGLRWAIPYALGIGASALLHVYVGMRMYREPFPFVAGSRAITQLTGTVEDFQILSFLRQLAGQLGGWPILLFILPGLWLLLRREGGFAGRAMAALFAWLFVVDALLVLHGSMQPRVVRYLVPVLVLALPSLLATSIALVPADRRRLRLGVALSLTLLLLGLGAWRAFGDARDAKLPAGIEEASDWLRTQTSGQRVLASNNSPDIGVMSRLPLPLVGALRGGRGHWDVGPEQLQQEVDAGRFELLVAVAWPRAFEILCETELRGVQRLFVAGDLAIYRLREPLEGDPPGIGISGGELCPEIAEEEEEVRPRVWALP